MGCFAWACFLNEGALEKVFALVKMDERIEGRRKAKDVKREERVAVFMASIATSVTVMLRRVRRDRGMRAGVKVADGRLFLV